MNSLVTASQKSPSPTIERSLPWLSPIEFSRGGIEGAENLRPFLDHVSERILNLGSVGAQWWVQKAIWQQSATGAPEVDLGNVKSDQMGFQNLRLRAVTQAILAAATQNGLEFLEGTRFVKVAVAQDVVFSKSEIIPEIPSTSSGALAIPFIPIPDLHDPRIYFPDIGTHQSCSGTAEQWKNLMEWEGRTDAEMVVRYLNAYNKFILDPSVENLLDATANPNTSKDPYFLGMRYIGEVFGLTSQENAKPGSQQQAIFELLGLIHVAFFPHYTNSKQGSLSRELQPCDHLLLEGLVQDFSARHSK